MAEPSYERHRDGIEALYQQRSNTAKLPGLDLSSDGTASRRPTALALSCVSTADSRRSCCRRRVPRRVA